jgi:2-polyprenyl-3-methyl-5-hydroxy-6-metoxy-1,4-benzoquinol methylase
MSRGPGGWDYSEVTPGGNDSHCLALELVGSNKTVLELGCRGGHMTRALAAQGCKVVGIDLDGEAAARAAGDAVEVIICNVEDPTCLEELSTADFDVVLAGDLLEHLTDPLPVLRRCRSLLNLGGFLVVSVPNVAHATFASAFYAVASTIGRGGCSTRPTSDSSPGTRS